MLSCWTNNIADAVRLLVAMGGFVAAPGPKSGLDVYDAIRKVAARPPRSLAKMADELTTAAGATFAGFSDAPEDADELFIQMVEIGLLTPSEITARGMDPSACVEAMLHKLTDETDPTGEMRRAEMRSLFTEIVRPALGPLLGTKEYAADLTPAYMAESLQTAHRIEGKIDNVSDKLDNLEAQTRVTLEALALRFGETAPEAMSLPDLKALLIKKARDYSALREEVEALRGTTPRIDNILAEVEAAIEALELVEADRLLASIRETTAETLRKPLEDNAKVMEAQARVALLRNDPKAAYAILSAAADSFASIEPVEQAARLLQAGDRLSEHGRRYGGPAVALGVDSIRSALDVPAARDRPELLRILIGNLSLAMSDQIEMSGGEGVGLLPTLVDVNKDLLSSLSMRDDPNVWAKTQQNIANLLATQAKFAAGGAKAKLHREAAGALRSALHALNESDHPDEWALANNNLGLMLVQQADIAASAERPALIEEAVGTFHAALRVRTKDRLPYGWGQTTQNLAGALVKQSLGASGEFRRRLLKEAVEHYRQALSAQSEAQDPVGRAITLTNLGGALLGLALVDEGRPDAAMLAEAFEANVGAISIFEQANYPTAWATASTNLGISISKIGEIAGGEAGAECQRQSKIAYEKALSVFSERSDPVEWARTTRALGLTHEAIAGSSICSDPRAELSRAEECYEAALRVYEPEHMPYNFQEATEALERVRRRKAKL